MASLSYLFLAYRDGEIPYALLHGNSIDLPTFICKQILRTFRALGHKIGIPNACLIQRLVISFEATFPEGVLERISHLIGNTTVSQS